MLYSDSKKKKFNLGFDLEFDPKNFLKYNFKDSLENRRFHFRGFLFFLLCSFIRRRSSS